MVAVNLDVRLVQFACHVKTWKPVSKLDVPSYNGSHSEPGNNLNASQTTVCDATNEAVTKLPRNTVATLDDGKRRQSDRQSNIISFLSTKFQRK